MKKINVFLLGIVCLFTIGATSVSMPTPVISDSITIMYEGELYVYDGREMFPTPVNEKGEARPGVRLIYYMTEDRESSIMRVRAYNDSETIGWAVYNKNHHGAIVDTDCDGVFETEVAPSDPIIVYSCYEETDNEND